MSNQENKKARVIKKVLKITLWTILGVAAASGFAILFGFVVVWLWNALMPVIFNLPAITFWQAVGLIILGKILFGGFGHGGDNDGKRKGKKKKHWDWEKECQNWDWKDCKDEDWNEFRKFWKEEGREMFHQFKDALDGDTVDHEPMNNGESDSQ